MTANEVKSNKKVTKIKINTYQERSEQQDHDALSALTLNVPCPDINQTKHN